jgi:hypothetical protein
MGSMVLGTSTVGVLVEEKMTGLDVLPPLLPPPQALRRVRKTKMMGQYNRSEVIVILYFNYFLVLDFCFPNYLHSIIKYPNVVYYL